MTATAATAVPRHIPNFQRIAITTFPMSSPVQDAAGNLSVSSLNGEIYTLSQQNNLQVVFSTGGQPHSVVYDAQNSAYVADIAHQAILSVTKIQQSLDIGQMVKDYQGAPLKGPSSLLLTPTTLFFTDSGPLGETNLQNSKGSLFAIDLQVNLLKPIVYNCLAGPQGIASWTSTSSASGYGGLVLFVSETYKNRVLRIAQQSSGQFHTSVFHQFSGRLGPTALSVHQDGTLFVARPDFPDVAKDGIISAINIQTGTHVYDFALPGMPDITGLSFSRQQKDLLYVTESTTNSIIKLSLEQQ